jgi:hypothetical protein
MVYHAQLRMLGLHRLAHLPPIRRGDRVTGHGLGRGFRWWSVSVASIDLRLAPAAGGRAFCDHGATSTNRAATGIAGEVAGNAGIGGVTVPVHHPGRLPGRRNPCHRLGSPAPRSMVSSQAPMNLVTIAQKGAGFS